MDEKPLILIPRIRKPKTLKAYTVRAEVEMIIRPEYDGPERTFDEDDIRAMVGWILYQHQPDYWTTRLDITEIAPAPEHNHTYDATFEQEET